MALPEWDLSDLYIGPTDPELERDLTGMVDRAAQFEAEFKGRIVADNVDITILRAALDRYEALIRAQYRPLSYASLLFSADTTNAESGALLQRAREQASCANVHLVFFDLAIAALAPNELERLLRTPELSQYHYYLQREHQRGQYNLSEAEEAILIKTTNTRGQAFSRLFTELHGRIRYTVKDGDGMRDVEQSDVLNRLYSPDRTVRADAATAITDAMKTQGHLGTFIFNTLLHEKEVIDNLRGFADAEASRHIANDVEAEVVHAMANVCAQNHHSVANYYELKQTLLQLPALTHYDRYAPLPTTATDTVSFAQAREIVLTAFGNFSPQLAEIAETFFTQNWIDAAVRPGKRGGAFCAGVTPDHHPFVLMNYTGRYRDVTTLAHELGHGIHDVLAARNHVLDYYPGLPMAETASTFAEMLVFDHMLNTVQNDHDRLSLLCDKIEDSFATVYRQLAMYRFEQRAHKARREQGELRTEQYNTLWQEEMQAMFGDSLELGDDHAWWWLYIPHIIHTPFYVYAYAFGELLVLSLYAQYMEMGHAFVNNYLEMLAAGGSKSPATLIQSMGFTIRDPAFWQRGCDLINDRVNQAIALSKSIG